MATNDKQTDVQLIRKFNDWEYSWYRSLNKRMPWFAKESGIHNKALLTTSSSPTYYPSGSIIWGGTDRNPADWIGDGGMINPGVIWYWVNEDDCDQDRQPGITVHFLNSSQNPNCWEGDRLLSNFLVLVNGGLTEWSEWGRCNKICEHGKQKRQKTCTNPKPRCGGKQCNSILPTEEERPCMYCPGK